jgi:hypothetical protein
MCDLVASKLTSVILIMNSNMENRKQVTIVAYPATREPFPLVDIAFVHVVVSLDAMQKGCSANQKKSPSRQEVPGRRSSSLVEHAPQKPDCRSLAKQMNSRTALLYEACLPSSCACKN